VQRTQRPAFRLTARWLWCTMPHILAIFSQLSGPRTRERPLCTQEHE
jgi:hypothetical protein